MFFGICFVPDTQLDGGIVWDDDTCPRFKAGPCSSRKLTWPHTGWEQGLWSEKRVPGEEKSPHRIKERGGLCPWKEKEDCCQAGGGTAHQKALY